MIADFFAWKIGREPRQVAKEKLAAVRGIVDAHAYTAKHLSAISDTTWASFLRTIQLGIPDGIALDFKKDLKVSKGQ